MGLLVSESMTEPFIVLVVELFAGGVGLFALLFWEKEINVTKSRVSEIQSLNLIRRNIHKLDLLLTDEKGNGLIMVNTLKCIFRLLTESGVDELPDCVHLLGER